MVSFKDSIKLAFQKAFDYKGCATRAEYWWFVLFSIFMNISTNLIDMFLFENGIFPFVGLIWLLILIVVMTSLIARRLHDINLSGWWQLIGLIPIIGFFVFIYWFTQPSKRPNKFCTEAEPEAEPEK